MTNPFEILGLDPNAELDADELETAYLRLSRECHPDFNPGLEGDAQIQLLTRSAEVNDSYRILCDPWRRAEAMITLRDPEAMVQTKTLCPMFLMEAMETREAVSDSTPEVWEQLQQDIYGKVQEYFTDVAEKIHGGKIREAATLLHQSNYYRKALADLRDRMHPTNDRPTVTDAP